MFSTLLTSPRAPLSRSHSTVFIPSVEFDGWMIALMYEISAGTRQITAAISATRLTRDARRRGGSRVSRLEENGGGVRRGGVCVRASMNPYRVGNLPAKAKEILRGSSSTAQLQFRNPAYVPPIRSPEEAL